MIELLFCLHLQTLSCRWITGSSHNSPGHSQSSSPVHTPNPHGQRYNALCSTVTSSHAGVCCVLKFKTEVLTAKKCPIFFYFFFSSIDPDVWAGGGSGNCIETRVAIVICFMYPSMLMAEFKLLFFFAPNRNPAQFSSPPYTPPQMQRSFSSPENLQKSAMVTLSFSTYLLL